GRAVGQAMRFYKLQPADIVVIYDELDLPPGKLRMKRGGGTAGHNGLKSIEAHIGKDFRRMRIGIGHPGAKELVHGYVLHDFAKSERDWVEPLLTAVADNAPLLAKGEDASFMNRVHLALAPADKEGGATRQANGAPAPASASKPTRSTGSAFADGLRKLLRRDA
ncbi:MAG TPA: aminoacyl-tRNA hydrolase, partial [Propylenella sp.]|nr:aminoacyl-tRNA hydrolase [Propylenella sp.]